MRRIRILLIMLMAAFLSASAQAQTKTVTNADLEKYRQKRLQAEKELRENYRELGFPSPAELERQNLQSRRELAELSRQLRDEELARRSDLPDDRYGQQGTPAGDSDYSSYPNPGFVDYGGYYAPVYYYGSYYGYRYGGYRYGSIYRNPAYRRSRRTRGRFRRFFRTIRRVSAPSNRRMRGRGRQRPPRRGGRTHRRR